MRYVGIHGFCLVNSLCDLFCLWRQTIKLNNECWKQCIFLSSWCYLHINYNSWVNCLPQIRILHSWLQIRILHSWLQIRIKYESDTHRKVGPVRLIEDDDIKLHSVPRNFETVSETRDGANEFLSERVMISNTLNNKVHLLYTVPSHEWHCLLSVSSTLLEPKIEPSRLFQRDLPQGQPIK